MAKTQMNLQDSFLNQVRKDTTEIQLILLDGHELNGTVRGFDNFTVIMNTDEGQHLIYKHAIAQVINTRPMRTHNGPPHGNDRPRTQSLRPAERTNPGRNSGPGDDENRFNSMDLSKVNVDENRKK